MGVPPRSGGKQLHDSGCFFGCLRAAELDNFFNFSASTARPVQLFVIKVFSQAWRFTQKRAAHMADALTQPQMPPARGRRRRQRGISPEVAQVALDTACYGKTNRNSGPL